MKLCLLIYVDLCDFMFVLKHLTDSLHNDLWPHFHLENEKEIYDIYHRKCFYILLPGNFHFYVSAFTNEQQTHAELVDVKLFNMTIDL